MNITVKDLDEANPGSVIETAATARFPGIRYVKKENGRWHMKHAANTPSAWLLDPQHSAQPIRWVSRG